MRKPRSKTGFSSIINAKDAQITYPKRWYTWVVTWFYVGRLGVATGTLGSIAVYPLYAWVISTAESVSDIQQKFAILAVLIGVVGWIAISKFEEDTRTHDHKSVVIDEVIAMLAVLAACFGDAYNISLSIYSITKIAPQYMAFILILGIFRYFDIHKPFFIRQIDRNLYSSLSVILDDLLAALYSCLVLYVLNILCGKFL